MTHKVLRSFPFSRNGIKIETAEAGAEIDLPSALVAGLEAAGFIGEPTAQSTHSVGEGAVKPAITAGWRDEHFMKQIHLAKQFDPSVTKKDDAVAVLEAAEKAAAEAQQA